MISLIAEKKTKKFSCQFQTATKEVAPQKNRDFSKALCKSLQLWIIRNCCLELVASSILEFVFYKVKMALKIVLNGTEELTIRKLQELFSSFCYA